MRCTGTGLRINARVVWSVALLGVSVIVGCYEPYYGDHPCETCQECEECVISFDEATCVPIEERAKLACGLYSDIVWLDSCGRERAVVEDCDSNMCVERENGDPFCKCSSFCR